MPGQIPRLCRHKVRVCSSLHSLSTRFAELEDQLREADRAVVKQEKGSRQAQERIAMLQVQSCCDDTLPMIRGPSDYQKHTVEVYKAYLDHFYSRLLILL